MHSDEKENVNYLNIQVDECPNLPDTEETDRCKIPESIHVTSPSFNDSVESRRKKRPVKRKVIELIDDRNQYQERF